MRDVLPQLGLVGVLVLLNAAFAGTELALVSLREGQLRRLEQRSATGATLARLAREPNRFLATIQIGITLAGFLASAAAAVSLAQPLEEPLAPLGSAAEPVAVLLVTIALAYVTLVLGELAPKRLAMQRAEGWGMFAARPLAAMATFTRPVVWLLSRSTDIAVKVLGGDPDQQREEVTREEIRDLLAAHTSFTSHQRHIIEGAFDVAERPLADVVQPRPDVLVLDAAAPASESLRRLAASTHSRAPVGQDGALDRTVAVVHLRDLLAGGDRLTGELGGPPCLLPDTVFVLDALRELQGRRTQLAVVVDEHGSGAGIVTVEDLVEELVGEIYDEADRDVAGARRQADGTVVVPGRFPLHDLADIDVHEVPDGPYSTVAGLVLAELGRIPERGGDAVDVAGHRFEVLAVDQRAITRVAVTPAAARTRRGSSTPPGGSGRP